jgi:DNA-binding transcriptional LysR family regulator
MVAAMELRHLRYFVAVAEELNFTRAAARLHVAQPALSRQMKDLEEEVGTKLFERGHAGVQLTRGGKTFYLRARSLLAAAVDAVNDTRTAGGAITGRVIIGFMSGLHLNYLHPALERLKREHPRVELDYFHGLPGQQMKALREGRIDIAFVNLPEPLAGLQHTVIWRVSFEVVLPRKHRLAHRREFVLEDLKGEDFVFCTRDARPEFYDDFIHHCSNAGFRPRIVKEIGGYPTNMLGLVSVGVGISVLPHFRDAERIRGLIWRPLVKPRWWTDFALVWRAETVSAAGAELVAWAERIFGGSAKGAEEPK